MESRRSDYDLLLLTANNVNQPQVFPLFYNATDPKHWQQTSNNGYLIIDPSEYGRYQMNRPFWRRCGSTTCACSSDYDELHRVLTPGGKVEYVIADVRKRRRFIRKWLLLGPFDNQGFRRREHRFRRSGGRRAARLPELHRSGVLAPRAAAVRAHRAQRRVPPRRRGGRPSRRVAVRLRGDADPHAAAEGRNAGAGGRERAVPRLAGRTPPDAVVPVSDPAQGAAVRSGPPPLRRQRAADQGLQDGRRVELHRPANGRPASRPGRHRGRRGAAPPAGRRGGGVRAAPADGGRARHGAPVRRVRRPVLGLPRQQRGVVGAPGRRGRGGGVADATRRRRASRPCSCSPRRWATRRARRSCG